MRVFARYKRQLALLRVAQHKEMDAVFGDLAD
jgi:hypothetical protein